MEARSSKSRRSGTKSGSDKVSSSSKKGRKTKKSTTTTSSTATKSRTHGGKVSGAGTDTTSVSTLDHSPRRRSADRNRRGGSGGAAGSSSEAACGTSCVLGALHVIDLGLGVACVVYGSMVHVVSVMAISISYGLLLALGSIAGAIGYCSRANGRVPGFVVSAAAGFLSSLIHVAAFVIIVSVWDPVIDFLKENQEDLLLTDDSIETIQGLEVPLAIVFILLACLEMYRCIAMCRMKKSKSSSSSSSRRRSSTRSVSSRRVSHLDSISVNSDTQPNWLLSWLGIIKKKRTDDLVLFDDNSSLDSALLWSNDGEPRPDDYLVFVPEHERSLTNFTTTISLPAPPEDRTDY